MKSKTFASLICLLSILNISVEADTPQYKLIIQNYTEFNWKITDLGLKETNEAFPGITRGIQWSTQGIQGSKPDDNPSEFGNIPSGTENNPSSTEVTWDYYYPTTIKLTVNPPSYMAGESTNVLPLGTQQFKLNNKKNGAEFQLTITDSIKETEGLISKHIINTLAIKKIRDFDYNSETISETIKEKKDAEIQKTIQNSGAKKINVTNNSPHYSIHIQFPETNRVTRSIIVGPHSQNSIDSEYYHYAAQGTSFTLTTDMSNHSSLLSETSTVNYNQPVSISTRPQYGPDVDFSVTFSPNASEDAVDIIVNPQ